MVVWHDGMAWWYGGIPALVWWYGMAWWYGMTVWHGGTVVFLH